MLVCVMLRTAIPLGYLFIALALGGLLLVGVSCFVAGWRFKKRPLKIVGAVISLGVIGLITAEVVMDSLLEWNPLVRNDSEVVGTWQRKRSFWMDLDETLTLRADHTFEYRSDHESFTGTWQRNDWNLHIAASGVDPLMRFISFFGELRLLRRPPDDPDTWDGDLGLKRVLPQASQQK